MTRSYLSPAQEVRARQINAAHTHVKELEEATAEAIKYHDKYFAAMEKVMTCLLDSSDTWADVRAHLGPTSATAMDSIGPSGGRLAAAYNTLKVSKELRVLRDQLEALKEATKSGRKHTKRAKAHVEEMEKCAKKCAEVNSAEYEAKVTQKTGKAKDKLVLERRSQNTHLSVLDDMVVKDLTSTGTWWCAKLVTHIDEIYDAYVNLGHRTLACFAESTSQQSAPQPPPAVPTNPPALINNFQNPPNAIAGPYNPATAASGVPLQFESRMQNVNAL